MNTQTGNPPNVDCGPWNPGLESSIPSNILSLSTMFSSQNVEVDFKTVHELADFTGLSPYDLSVFKPERMIVHELLVRITADLSVPDGPEYEELGINLRTMTARIFDGYIQPRLDELKRQHEQLRKTASGIIQHELHQLREPEPHEISMTEIRQADGLMSRVMQRLGFGPKPTAPATLAEPSHAERISRLEALAHSQDSTLQTACRSALLTVMQAIVSHRGDLMGDDGVLVSIATGIVLNSWGSSQLGTAIQPLIEEAVAGEGYRFLPAQPKPVIMNVKGASASGKSTIRPKQRELAERLNIPWQDFAIISPDYWRKFLLDYETLADDHKYGAMLTGHELAIIDSKLDRYMAEKAKAGDMPHLLIDRFRFDSFNTGEDNSSQLLTRFGDTVFMFFMITPPEATIDRAYARGIATGRYKAVDDLLDHNVEAYTGMPDLFFSWALSSKRVHCEFLDNSVALGQRPRTVALGWNDDLTILDISKFLDVERYRKINIDALSPQDLLGEAEHAAALNADFLKKCSRRLSRLRFLDRNSGTIYGAIEAGEWTYQNRKFVSSHIRDEDTLTGLAALGWDDAEITSHGQSETNPDKPDLEFALGSLQ